MAGTPVTRNNGAMNMQTNRPREETLYSPVAQFADAVIKNIVVAAIDGWWNLRRARRRTWLAQLYPEGLEARGK